MISLKKVLILLLLLVVHTSCFAAPVAHEFKEEEKAADALISFFTDKTLSYNEASVGFSDELKKSFPAEKLNEMKSLMKKHVGNIKSANLHSFARQFNKTEEYMDTDEMIYVGSDGKGKFAQFIILFINKNGNRKINAFRIMMGLR